MPKNRVHAHVFEKKWRSDDVRLQEEADFSSLLLSEKVLLGLKNAGFKKPSPIQLEAVPVGRFGKDLLVQAKSGTGKTLVFTIIALEALLEVKHPQVLMMAPTREIALQIRDVVRAVGSAFEDLTCNCFIGGLPIDEDAEKVLGCQIIVGTPGRLKHLINIGVLPTNSIRLLVLDEADVLLETPFKSELDFIFQSLPNDKQVIATSATYPDELRYFISHYFRNVFMARLNRTDLSLLGMVHYIYPLQLNKLPLLAYKVKLGALEKLLVTIRFSQCLVFCNLISRVEPICQEIRKWGFTSAYISSLKEQEERIRAIDGLKNFRCKVLVTSDVTSRGIDAENVDLIINFDNPFNTETYFHRCGRAGRYGSKGVAITFLTEDEIKKFEGMKSKENFQAFSLPDPIPSNLISIRPEVSDALSKEDSSDEDIFMNSVNDISNGENIANDATSLKAKQKNIANVMNSLPAKASVIQEIEDMDGNSYMDELKNSVKFVPNDEIIANCDMISSGNHGPNPLRVDSSNPGCILIEEVKISPESSQDENLKDIIVDFVLDGEIDLKDKKISSEKTEANSSINESNAKQIVTEEVPSCFTESYIEHKSCITSVEKTHPTEPFPPQGVFRQCFNSILKDETISNGENQSDFIEETICSGDSKEYKLIKNEVNQDSLPSVSEIIASNKPVTFNMIDSNNLKLSSDSISNCANDLPVNNDKNLVENTNQDRENSNNLIGKEGDYNCQEMQPYPETILHERDIQFAYQSYLNDINETINDCVEDMKDCKKNIRSYIGFCESDNNIEAKAVLSDSFSSVSDSFSSVSDESGFSVASKYKIIKTSLTDFYLNVYKSYQAESVNEMISAVLKEKEKQQSQKKGKKVKNVKKKTGNKGKNKTTMNNDTVCEEQVPERSDLIFELDEEGVKAYDLASHDTIMDDRYSYKMEHFNTVNGAETDLQLPNVQQLSNFQMKDMFEESIDLTNYNLSQVENTIDCETKIDKEFEAVHTVSNMDQSTKKTENVTDSSGNDSSSENTKLSLIPNKDQSNENTKNVTGSCKSDFSSKSNRLSKVSNKDQSIKEAENVTDSSESDSSSISNKLPIISNKVQSNKKSTNLTDSSESDSSSISNKLPVVSKRNQFNKKTENLTDSSESDSSSISNKLPIVSKRNQFNKKTEKLTDSSESDSSSESNKLSLSSNKDDTFFNYISKGNLSKPIAGESSDETSEKLKSYIKIPLHDSNKFPKTIYPNSSSTDPQDIDHHSSNGGVKKKKVLSSKTRNVQKASNSKLNSNDYLSESDPSIYFSGIKSDEIQWLTGRPLSVKKDLVDRPISSIVDIQQQHINDLEICDTRRSLENTRDKRQYKNRCRGALSNQANVSDSQEIKRNVTPVNDSTSNFKHHRAGFNERAKYTTNTCGNNAAHLNFFSHQDFPSYFHPYHNNQSCPSHSTANQTVPQCASQQEHRWNYLPGMSPNHSDSAADWYDIFNRQWRFIQSFAYPNYS